MKFEVLDVKTRLVEIAAVFGIAVAIIVPGFWLVGDAIIARQMVVWVANIAMILTVWLALRRRGQTLSDIGVRPINWSPRGALRLIGASVLAFLLAVAGFVLASIVMVNITGVPEEADMGSYEFLSGNLPMLLVALSGVFVASSFGEELVYRGFLTTTFAEMFGDTRRAWIWAVALSSVFFGLAHYDWGPMGVLQTTAMGAALGTAWLKSKRNLWVVILAHAYMDFLLMLQMYLS